MLAQTETVSATSLRQIVPAAAEAGEWFIAYNTLSVPRSELCRVRVPGIVGRASRLPEKHPNRAPSIAGEMSGGAGETPALPSGLRLEDADGRAVAFRVVDVQGAGSASHEPKGDLNGPLSLSLSPSKGERVPKAGEGLVHGIRARIGPENPLPER